MALAQDVLLFVSLFLSLSLISGNNLSSCVGTAVGAKIISLKSAMLLGTGGFVLGLITLGHNMVRSSMSLLPNDPGSMLISEILLGTVVVFLLGNVVRVPLSITISLVGLLVGVEVARGEPLDWSFLTHVLEVWVSAPIVSIAVAFLATRATIYSKPRHPFSRAHNFKLFIIVASFLTAFASGANSLALIVAIAGFGTVQLVVSIIAMVFGSFYLSSRQIRRVGVELLMLRYSTALLTLLTSSFLMGLASIIGIPLSSTQTLSASIFGGGISYKQKFISFKPFLTLVVGWVAALLLSVAIGLFL